MRLSYTLIAILHLSIFVNLSLADCPGGWAQFQKRCYLVVEDKMHFNAAVKYCQKYTARLANAETEEIDMFLETIMEPNSDYFLGGHHQRTGARNWYWSDGKVFDYENWGPHQPNGSGSCMAKDMEYDGEWADCWCDFDTKFVCEVDLH